MTAFSVAADILEGVSNDPLDHLDWQTWNATVAAKYFPAPYAPHHERFWEWTDTITATARPDPFAAFWPRGHTKSTCAEIAGIKLGARKLRHYALYVCATQDQADDHVDTIASILESPGFEQHYPAMASRRLGKHGNSKGWRRNRLRTASGFTVDALGLDTAARGAKLEEHRPDMLILDDIDSQHDSPRIVERKLRTITQAILPALTPTAVVILAQNFVHPNSIAVQIATGKADLLGGAIHSGPFPAVEGLQAEVVDGLWTVTAGDPTWQGMDLAACEAQIRLMGWIAFVIECQQDIAERPGALTSRDDWEASRVTTAQVPELDRKIVSIDPNKTGRGDDAGVVVIGRGDIGNVQHSYTLADYSGRIKPSEWRDAAAGAYLQYGCGQIVVEGTGLGEHAELTIKGAPALRDHPVRVVTVDAKLGKKDRARPIAQLVKDRRHHHVGVLPYLENQWCGWEPETSPMSPGGVDAEVHGVTHLLIDNTGAPKVRFL